MGAYYNDVINRIKAERTELGLSQKEMARFVCINQSNYSKVEQGTRRFSYSELKYLSDSPVDVLYVITGKRCGEKYKEYFSRYRYEQLVNIMNIISSVVAGVNDGDLQEYWKTIYINAEVFLCKENKKRSEINMFFLIRRLRDYRQRQMASLLGVDVKKLRDLENSRSLPDSELIWKMHQIFGLSPAFLLKDKNCLVSEVCFMLEHVENEIQDRILSVIDAIYLKV